MISKREEDDLEEYVQRQLTRTRSGHRLERDVETGGLTTRHNRRSKSQHQLGSGDNLSHSNLTPETSEIMTPTTPQGLYIIVYHIEIYIPLILKNIKYVPI